MNSLDGTFVAITGAFGNLGLVTAQVLAERGAKVALIGRGKAPANLPASLAQACVARAASISRNGTRRNARSIRSRASSAG